MTDPTTFYTALAEAYLQERQWESMNLRKQDEEWADRAFGEGNWINCPDCGIHHKDLHMPPEHVRDINDTVHPKTKIFKAILSEIEELHNKKSQDYGSHEDPFWNISAAQQFDIPPWKAAVLRANDKMARIQSFCQKGNLVNEPLEDALLDQATYLIIALVEWRILNG
jgi:hypothetical protein